MDQPISIRNFSSFNIAQTPASTVQTDKPKSALETEICTLRERIDSAHLHLERLTERLAPILRPCQTIKQETPAPVAPKPPTSFVVNEIQAHRHAIEDLIDKMTLLNDHLDT